MIDYHDDVCDAMSYAVAGLRPAYRNDPVTVYRLEAKCGKGVYCSGEHPRFRPDAHPLPHYVGEPFDRHSNPDAPPIHEESKYFFGFSSIDQLLRWFTPKDIRIILSRGKVRVVAYEVPSSHVAFGKSQVAFLHPGVEHCRPLDSHELLRLTVGKAA